MEDTFPNPNFVASNGRIWIKFDLNKLESLFSNDVGSNMNVSQNFQNYNTFSNTELKRCASTPGVQNVKQNVYTCAIKNQGMRIQMEKLRDSDIGTVRSNSTEILKQMSLQIIEVTSIVHGRQIPHAKPHKSRDASRDLGHKEKSAQVPADRDTFSQLAKPRENESLV